MRLFSKRAFSLAEIIIVVIIVGILAGLSIPHMTVTVEKHRAEEGKNILLTLYGSQKRYHMDNDAYSGSLDTLDVEIPSVRYFYNLTVKNDPTELASITRNDDLYQLSIDENGEITCTDLSPHTYCKRLGIDNIEEGGGGPPAAPF